MNTDEIRARLQRFQARMAFNGRQRARVYGKLAGYLRNSMPLSEALDTLHRSATRDGRHPNDPVAYVLREWRAGVMNGRSLARSAGDWISESDRVVLEAGEKSGNLEIALENALYIGSATKRIRSAVIGGLAYPFALIAIAVGLCLLFGLQVIPAFKEIIPEEKWEGGAALLIYVSRFADTYALPTVVVFVAASVALWWSMPRWVGPVRARLDKFPPWSVYRLVQGAGFMLSVSSLLRAGAAVPEILSIMARGATPWYEERIVGAMRYVANGKNLGEALHLAGHDFPDDETVQDLRDYARMDKFDEVLEKLGREWVETSVVRIQGQMSILKQIGIVVAGGAIAVIASGLMSLQGQLNTAVSG